jgi:hypothetical protein
VAVVEREATVGPVDHVARWIFDRVNVITLAVAVLGASVLIHGYGTSGAMWETKLLVVDPFGVDSRVGAWRYQSPTGYLLAWVVGADDAPGIAAVNFAMVAGFVIGGALMVRRLHSDLAARLFLLAFFCSPQAWAGAAYLGIFDVITIAAITLCFFGGPPVALAGGVLLGFHHFEQGMFALAAVTVIRVVMRGDDRRPMIAAWVGLVVGKAALHVLYLWPNDLPTSGRSDFLRDRGVGTMIDGWRGQLPTLLWAVFNVLWVAMFWMLAEQTRRDRLLTCALFGFLTLPVLITFDLSRVYRNVTWPLVLLLVVFAAEHRDQRRVRWAAVVLMIGAVFVPRTEIWHGGLVLN